MSKKNILAGLEIGRSMVSMVAGEVAEGKLNFLFASKKRCVDGVKNGMVVKLDSVTEAITGLVEEAGNKGIKPITSAYLNISGLNINEEITGSVVTLPHRGCEIERRHIADLIESCKIVSIPMDRHLLYILPQEYIVDGQGDIKDPSGLCGSRLEARIMMVTAPFNQVRNIVKAANFAGLDVKDVVLTALANANAVMSPEERRHGTLLIDMKTDFTELAIVREGELLFFKTIPTGQNNITSEIASRLNISLELAEEMKIRYGYIDNSGQDTRSGTIIPIEWMGRKDSVERGHLNKIISEQLSLIFGSVRDEIRGFKNFNDVVRTGAVIMGGAVSGEGFLEWAAQNLGFAVRVGKVPQDIGPLDQSYAAAVGLLKIGLTGQTRRKEETGFIKKVFRKTGDLLNDYF